MSSDEVEQAIEERLDEVMDATGGVLVGGVLYGGARQKAPTSSSRVSRFLQGPRGPVRVTGSKTAVSAVGAALTGGRVTQGDRHCARKAETRRGHPTGAKRCGQYMPGPARSHGGARIGGRMPKGTDHCIRKGRGPSGKQRCMEYGPGPRGGARSVGSRRMYGGKGTSAGASHNPYVAFLKRLAQQRGVSYGEAMIMAKNEGLWQGAM